MLIEPLKPAPLRAALAAFMNVSPNAIRIEHDTSSLRRAIARAIRAYQGEAAPMLPTPLNDNEEGEPWPTTA